MYPVLPHVLQDRPGPFVQARTAPLADEHFSPSKSDRNDPSRRMRARRRANRAYYSLFEANPESYPTLLLSSLNVWWVQIGGKGLPPAISRLMPFLSP